METPCPKKGVVDGTATAAGRHHYPGVAAIIVALIITGLVVPQSHKDEEGACHAATKVAEDGGG